MHVLDLIIIVLAIHRVQQRGSVAWWRRGATRRRGGVVRWRLSGAAAWCACDFRERLTEGTEGNRRTAPHQVPRFVRGAASAWDEVETVVLA